MISSVKVPFGRPLRLTLSESVLPFSVRTTLPRSLIWALTSPFAFTSRSLILKLRRLRHFLFEGTVARRVIPTVLGAAVVFLGVVVGVVPGPGSDPGPTVSVTAAGAPTPP